MLEAAQTRRSLRVLLMLLMMWSTEYRLPATIKLPSIDHVLFLWPCRLRPSLICSAAAGRELMRIISCIRQGVDPHGRFQAVGLVHMKRTRLEPPVGNFVRIFVSYYITGYQLFSLLFICIFLIWSYIIILGNSINRCSLMITYYWSGSLYQWELPDNRFGNADWWTPRVCRAQAAVNGVLSCIPLADSHCSGLYFWIIWWMDNLLSDCQAIFGGMTV